MEIKKHDELPIIYAEGEIDHWQAPELEQTINEVIDEGHNQVIVDFNKLTYIDSGGISILFLGLQKLKTLNGKLIVVTNNKNIIKILDLVNITRQSEFSLCSSLVNARKRYLKK